MVKLAKIMCLGWRKKLKLDESRAVAHLDIFRTPSSLGRWRARAKELPDRGLWHRPRPFRLLLMPWPRLFMVGLGVIELAKPVFIRPGSHGPDRLLYLPRMPVQVTG